MFLLNQLYYTSIIPTLITRLIMNMCYEILNKLIGINFILKLDVRTQLNVQP